MNKRLSVGVSALACLVFASLVPALPSMVRKGSAASAQNTREQSVTGKIASIGKSSFTLTVASPQTASESGTSESGTKSMTFLVDDTTTIEGSLRVGAAADVTYREAGGSYVAVSVRVAPESGL